MSILFRLTPVLLIALTFAIPAWSQSEHPVTGRRIAGVMGMAGADWLERDERELEENPDKAVNALGLKPGMSTADIGAGVGYFSIRMAKKIAPGGKLYAVDVQPEMLSLLKQRVAKAKVINIVPVLGTETDPKLAAKSMDRIVMVDVYHELSQPQRMLANIKAALKDDGRLILLEYRKEDPHIPIRPEHKMSIEEAKAELEAEGFKLEKVLEDLPRQHILIFRKDIM